MKSVYRLFVIVAALGSITMGIPRICGALDGDVNVDNKVNVFDALQTLQYAVGLYQPPNEPAFILNADVAPLSTSCMPQGDSKVDVFDSLAILRHAVGLDLWDGSCPPIPTYSITGNITTNGTGLSGVQVSIVGHSVTTQANGAYVLSGLSNGNYTVTPLKSGYTFTPQTRSVTISSADVTLFNFSATSVTLQNLTVNSGGSSNAGNANNVYHIQSSSADYTYTITNFGVNDQLVFPAGPAPSVDNSSFTDGKVKLSVLSAGITITVELTNLTPEQDGKIIDVNSINALFGPGTVSQQ